VGFSHGFPDKVQRIPRCDLKTHLKEMANMNDSKGYWAATLSLLSKILVVWFLASYGAGILFAPALNTIQLGGYPLGFFFAQQGSIWVFLLLIWYYTKKMGEIDRAFGVSED
jgi:putative solute:sodium symporter small subunit